MHSSPWLPARRLRFFRNLLTRRADHCHYRIITPPAKRKRTSHQRGAPEPHDVSVRNTTASSAAPSLLPRAQRVVGRVGLAQRGWGGGCHIPPSKIHPHSSLACAHEEPPPHCSLALAGGGMGARGDRGVVHDPRDHPMQRRPRSRPQSPLGGASGCTISVNTGSASQAAAWAASRG